MFGSTGAGAHGAHYSNSGSCAPRFSIHLQSKSYGNDMNQQRMFLPPVQLKISFADLLGNNDSEITEADRRDRWQQWLALAAKNKYRLDIAWTDTDGCNGCQHLDGNWCSLMRLPCTVNPYLSYNYGMVGMACAGAGKSIGDQQ